MLHYATADNTTDYQRHTHTHTHIITDSKYVYDGVTLYMHRWALEGRRVTNQDLWESLKAVLRARSAETLWKHVYNHVGIVGNERADSLANQGRRRHPDRVPYLRLARQGQRPVVLAS